MGRWTRVDVDSSQRQVSPARHVLTFSELAPGDDATWVGFTDPERRPPRSRAGPCHSARWKSEVAKQWAPQFDKATRPFQYALLQARSGTDALATQLRVALERSPDAIVGSLGGRAAYDTMSCESFHVVPDGSARCRPRVCSRSSAFSTGAHQYVVGGMTRGRGKKCIKGKASRGTPAPRCCMPSVKMSRLPRCSQPKHTSRRTKGLSLSWTTFTSCPACRSHAASWLSYLRDTVASNHVKTRMFGLCLRPLRWSTSVRMCGEVTSLSVPIGHPTGSRVYMQQNMMQRCGKRSSPASEERQLASDLLQGFLQMRLPTALQIAAFLSGDLRTPVRGVHWTQPPALFCGPRQGPKAGTDEAHILGAEPMQIEPTLTSRFVAYLWRQRAWLRPPRGPWGWHARARG